MKQSELWDGLYGSNPVAWRGNARVPHPNSGRALDVGCGNGKTTSTLVDLGYETTGVDFSETAVRLCSDAFEDSARFHVASVLDLPFEDGSFDYVTAVHVLEHLEDDELRIAAGEIRRILSEGGYVFIRSFTENDMRSGSRCKGDITYRYRFADAMTGFFDGFEVVSSELVEEMTRFNTLRSRIECLLRKDLRA